MHIRSRAGYLNLSDQEFDKSPFINWGEVTVDYKKYFYSDNFTYDLSTDHLCPRQQNNNYQRLFSEEIQIRFV